MNLPLERLGRELVSIQNSWLERAVPLDAARSEFLLQARAVQVGPGPRPAARLWVLTAAAVVVFTLSGLALWRFLPSSAPVAAMVRDKPAQVHTWVRSEANEQVPIQFSDGSSMVLEPGSQARIAELRPDGATLAIESGGIDVSVAHRPNTNYRLNFGPFAVRVTGTRFSVDWRPDQDQFRLSLREGSVVVSGCAIGDPRPLRGGEVLTASCRDGRFEITRGAAPPVAESNEPSDPGLGAKPDLERETKSAARPSPRPARPSAEPAWRALARSGGFKQALASLDPSAFEAECERASSTDLALLADVARFGGNPNQALHALSALRRRFAGSARANAAAFSIARIHFDQRGAYAQAAQWFRTYLSEQPQGPLAREAQGRLMEALHRGGDREGARRMAERYLASNPEGPHARLARTVLER